MGELWENLKKKGTGHYKTGQIDNLKEERKMDKDRSFEKLVEEYFGCIPPINRLEDWDKFSQEMHNYWEEFSKEMRSYIEKYTILKYQGEEKFDLIAIMDPMDCIWNILRYALRMFRKRGKKFDIQKIAHYAQIAWTKSKESGDVRSIGIEPDDRSNS